ncbi:hypothetical protein AS200_15070 [Streptomyces sp. CdTB01]|nr:hypothetical protein AS200_15070 [Streptomyces sp. CdTB01]
MLTVGRVAQQTGLTPKAVRLYEAHGLIASPARNASGYRIYEPEDLPVLRFIRQAQALGLTLKEIKTVLDTQRDGRSPCTLVTRLLDRHLAEAERRIAELHALRDALHTALAHHAPSTHEEAAAICPVIEAAARHQAQQSHPGAQPQESADCRSEPGTAAGGATQQPSPRHASRPSFTATAEMTRAANGSAHDQPSTALATRPTRSTAER